jgi:ABC transporter with metal-binding/Fe-S-binding domain ATP-binding protein
MTNLNIAALFSGGKDSVYSLYQAQKAGLNVKYLITAYAQKDSYMYHVPAILVSRIVAHALEIPQITFRVTEEDEISPLREALSKLDVEGVVCGAVASNYQRSRVIMVCDDLQVECFLPLWHKDPVETLAQMVDDGFQILIVSVAAMGLDEHWLGKILSSDMLDVFLEVCEKNRIHPMGEGGEYETLVLSGPNMRGQIEVDFNKKWYGKSGELEISRVSLVQK